MKKSIADISLRDEHNLYVHLFSEYNCILHLTDKERDANVKAGQEREREGEKTGRKGIVAMETKDSDGKREKLASRREGPERKRSVWILYRRTFYYEVSSCSVRSVGDAGERGRVAYQRAPAVSRIMDHTGVPHPTHPLSSSSRKDTTKDSRARERRARCWSALSRAVALNIKTLYMSANVPRAPPTT